MTLESAPENALDDLAWRGLVQQVTAGDLKGLLGAPPVTVYSGFDPSGPSLHAGNLVPLMLLAHLRRRGHQVLPLVGQSLIHISEPTRRS